MKRRRVWKNFLAEYFSTHKVHKTSHAHLHKYRIKLKLFTKLSPDESFREFQLNKS